MAPNTPSSPPNHAEPVPPPGRPPIYSLRPSAMPLRPRPPLPAVLLTSDRKPEVKHVTVVLVSNLHCNSCVRTIQDALGAMDPPALSVSVSIVEQTVTVEHTQQITPTMLEVALLDAGFDVAFTEMPASSADLEAALAGPPPFKKTISQMSFHRSGRRDKHAEHCLLCRNELANASPPVRPDDIVDADTLPGGKIEDPRQKATAAEGDSDKGYRASFFVGGMTCASCSGTVTSLLSDLEGVSNIAVNLLGKSASATLDRRELVETILKTVDDGGFECELASVEPLAAREGANDPHENAPRTVTLKIAGMFCKHCPEQLVAALKPFGSRVTLLRPFDDHNNPLMYLSYQPSAPFFTIRDIINDLSAAKASSAGSTTAFAVSVYHSPSLEDRARAMQAREQRSLLYRLLSSILIAIPTFIIGVVYMDLARDGSPVRRFVMEPIWAGNVARGVWAMFILATPVMFYSAGGYHKRSIKEIRALWRKGSKTPIWKRFVRFGSMNLLISTGVAVAYFSSIALLGLAAAQSRSTSGQGDTTTYFDSVVFLTMFLLIGRFLEAYSKVKTADAISSLRQLRPREALILVPSSKAVSVNGTAELAEDSEKGRPKADWGVQQSEGSVGFKVQKMAADFLEVGDTVCVPSGSSPPADGVIVVGETSFDESSLTGESRPVKKTVMDNVFVGTINKGTAVDVRVSAVDGTTMLDHIVDVVREGQARRAPIERVVDLLTGYFVPVITLLAIITFVVWVSLGYSGALPTDYLDIEVGGWAVWALEFSIAVFVVACPCGIGLAAPTALLVGSGLAAKNGILARGGGEAFQEMARIDIVVFDKTGTLTEGVSPKVTDLEVIERPGLTRDTILGLAGQVEGSSSHPLATAIREHCDRYLGAASVASDVQEQPARGLKAVFSSLGRSAIIGNEQWMADHGVSPSGTQVDMLSAWKAQGKSVVLLALSALESTDSHSISFDLAAMFAIIDPPRTEAKNVIIDIQDRGIATWMITGDNEITARAVATAVGIPQTNVIAGVLPDGKATMIRWLQQVGMKRRSRGRRWLGRGSVKERAIVAMVGDGINDSPALAAADVGIAIGSGSDVAISTAAFILVSSNLESLLTLLALSQRVLRRVKINFLWAFIYNLIALPVAAGVIYPAGHVRLPPVWASLAMALSSVTVVLSSLLLRIQGS